MNPKKLCQHPCRYQRGDCHNGGEENVEKMLAKSAEGKMMSARSPTLSTASSINTGSMRRSEDEPSKKESILWRSEERRRQQGCPSPEKCILNGRRGLERGMIIAKKKWNVSVTVESA